MFKDTVEQISRDFINEALSSPRLLEDMAAMEKYMAESYGGRVFIELMQNADDANSTKIKLCEFAGNLIFANNGRPFNDKDVIAISRSGASSKQRGIHIGYRGVGFKSTTYLSNEIIIYSSETFFSYSKSICSQQLNKEKDKVPTIRIPFLLESNQVGSELVRFLEHLITEGYNTIFVFKNAKIDEFIEEIQGINSGFFVFLRNIELCEINVRELIFTYAISRAEKGNVIEVSISGNKLDQWIITGNETPGIAFKCEKGEIISCNGDEAVYYCYLPTFDKVAFPIKVNGNFSTDPSRKHLIVDEVTTDTIQHVAKVLFELAIKIMNRDIKDDWDNILQILSQKTSFSKVNLILSDTIKEFFLNSRQLKINNGETIKISDYKLFPGWLEESEKIYIRRNSPYVYERSINISVYKKGSDVDDFIKQYSDEKFSVIDFIEIMSDKEFAQKLSTETQGKIIGNIIKMSRTESISDLALRLEKITLHSNGNTYSMADLIRGKKKNLDQQIKDAVNHYTPRSDVIWFCNTYSIEQEVLLNQNTSEMQKKELTVKTTNLSSKPAISKWRSAEQQCVELEKYFGNDPIDVSKQNLGYDVESKTKNGDIRYIEVKLLNSSGASFTMTNNEYTAAHLYGNSYFLCLITSSDIKLNVTYIQNPLINLQLEKRVKQWEWYCESYRGEDITVEF
jgi:hypothetical protein